MPAEMIPLAERLVAAAWAARHDSVRGETLIMHSRFVQLLNARRSAPLFVMQLLAGFNDHLLSVAPLPSSRTGWPRGPASTQPSLVMLASAPHGHRLSG